MDEEAIRVWFCSPDVPFVQLMARTLGAEFELQTIEAFHLNGARRRIDWPDVVLLDLRAEGDSPAGGELAFQLMQDYFRQSHPIGQPFH